MIWGCGADLTKSRVHYLGYSLKEMVLWMDAKEEGREEERKKTEAEKERADKAEAEVARYKAKFGELKD